MNKMDIKKPERYRKLHRPESYDLVGVLPNHLTNELTSIGLG